MEGEEIFEAEKLAFAVFVLLYALEVATLLRSVVADIGLLLFVNLASVNNFFNRTRRDESKDLDVAKLANPVGSVLGL